MASREKAGLYLLTAPESKTLSSFCLSGDGIKKEVFSHKVIFLGFLSGEIEVILF
jgi:hypothetical protein